MYSGITPGYDSATGPPCQESSSVRQSGGTAVNSEASSARLRGELHHHYHCTYYTGRCDLMSSDQRARSPSCVIRIVRVPGAPTPRKTSVSPETTHSISVCTLSANGMTMPGAPSMTSLFAVVDGKAQVLTCSRLRAPLNSKDSHPVRSTAIKKQIIAAVSDKTRQRCIVSHCPCSVSASSAPRLDQHAPFDY